MKDIIKKIDAGESLNEHEISSLIYDAWEEDRMEGENRRWSRTNTSIIKIEDRYFAIDWEEGLTEMQENEFWNQPEEVYPHTYEKTITVTDWIPMKRRDK